MGEWSLVGHLEHLAEGMGGGLAARMYAALSVLKLSQGLKTDAGIETSDVWVELALSLTTFLMCWVL